MTDEAEREQRLEAFLAAQLPNVGRIEVDDYAPISGGYSREMASFTARLDGVERRFVSRADPPPERAFIVTDRDREWALLSALTARGGVPMPGARFYDADGSVLGAKTIILDAVDGGTFAAQLDLTDETALPDRLQALAKLAADIHAVDVADLPEELDPPADWNEYFENCIAAWRTLEAEHSESLPVFRHVASWLELHRPRPAPLALVHGELQPPNILIGAEGDLLAVDWEVARIGDPREDLGWFQFITSVAQPPDIIGPNAADFCRRYRELTGLDEALVNPSTILYFAILPSAPTFGLVLRNLQALADGTASSMTSAFIIGFLSASQAWWLNAMKQVEASA